MDALLHSQDAFGTALARDAKGRTPIIAAAAQGHANVAALLLAAAPEGAGLCDTKGRSALFHAAAGHQVAAVQLLLGASGAAGPGEPGGSSEWASTPLHWAVGHGCCEADVRTILEAAPGDATAIEGDTAEDGGGMIPLQVRLGCNLYSACLARCACSFAMHKGGCSRAC